MEEGSSESGSNCSWCYGVIVFSEASICKHQSSESETERISSGNENYLCSFSAPQESKSCSTLPDTSEYVHLENDWQLGFET